MPATLRRRWLCHCRTACDVNGVTRVVELHETPAGRFCPMSFCVVSPVSLVLYALADDDAAASDNPGLSL